jgi:hypothetical protein
VTVSELIEQLRKEPKDAAVFVLVQKQGTDAVRAEPRAVFWDMESGMVGIVAVIEENEVSHAI